MVSTKRTFLKKVVVLCRRDAIFHFFSCLGPPKTFQIEHGETASNLMIFLVHGPIYEFRLTKFMLIFAGVLNGFCDFGTQKNEKS